VRSGFTEIPQGWSRISLFVSKYCQIQAVDNFCDSVTPVQRGSGRFLIPGAHFSIFRKGALMSPGRPSAVAKAGLDVNLREQEDGSWSIVLTDDTGTVVFDRTYTTKKIAQQQARKWVQEAYQTDISEQTSPPRPKQTRSPRRNSIENLAAMLLDRADRSEEEAVEMRIQADRLEVEAKRLRGAAETLGDGLDAGQSS